MPDRCSLCPGINTCIPADGEGDILFVGEAPGKQENQKGRAFIGKTGDEVNRHYLPLAGLARGRVRITNAIRCLPTSAGGKLDPKKGKDIALLESCAQRFLYPEMLRGRYQVIVPMGTFACKAVCPEVDLEHQHGIPFENEHGLIFPMYHPALGIYEPKKMLLIRTDWQRLRWLLKGTLALPEDAYPNPDYREVTDVSEIQEMDHTIPLAGDTESTRKREPFCLTFSQRAGHGRLIRASRVDLLQAFQQQLSRWVGPILFHNWFYDWTVTEAMGLRFPYHRIIDTMAEVYRLGNLPQGLKALAYRELGMTMQDFEDLVIPYSREHVLNYYRIAQTVTWPKPDEDLIIDDKTGLWKSYKPQSMNTKLKRFFTDYSNNAEKDVFKMWEDNWTSQQGMIEAEIGEWPGACISHVPFGRVLNYACRDADALIRLWPVLRAMRSRVRRVPQEYWRHGKVGK